MVSKHECIHNVEREMLMALLGPEANYALPIESEQIGTVVQDHWISQIEQTQSQNPALICA